MARVLYRNTGVKSLSIRERIADRKRVGRMGVMFLVFCRFRDGRIVDIATGRLPSVLMLSGMIPLF